MGCQAAQVVRMEGVGGVPADGGGVGEPAERRGGHGPRLWDGSGQAGQRRLGRAPGEVRGAHRVHWCWSEGGEL